MRDQPPTELDPADGEPWMQVMPREAPAVRELEPPTAPRDAPGAPPEPARTEHQVDLQLRLTPQGVLVGLGAVAVVLAALHTAFMIWHYDIAEIPWLIRSLFDLDEEMSFGTWASAVFLLFAAAAAALCAQRPPRVGDPPRWPWTLLSIGFVVLSTDEIAGIHESVNTALGDEISWAIPGGILAGVIGLAYVPFLLALPRRTMFMLTISGALYLGGAVGVELATEPYAHNYQLDTLEYNLTTVVEEALEMAGVILFVSTCLAWAAGSRGLCVGLRLAPHSPDS